MELTSAAARSTAIDAAISRTCCCEIAASMAEFAEKRLKHSGANFRVHHGTYQRRGALHGHRRRDLAYLLLRDRGVDGRDRRETTETFWREFPCSSWNLPAPRRAPRPSTPRSRVPAVARSRRRWPRSPRND